MSGLIVITCIILGLLMALIVMIQIAISQRDKIKELKAELEKGQKIAYQKEKINTGDINTDFTNSIDILSNYSNRK